MTGATAIVPLGRFTLPALIFAVQSSSSLFTTEDFDEFGSLELSDELETNSLSDSLLTWP